MCGAGGVVVYDREGGGWATTSHFIIHSDLIFSITYCNDNTLLTTSTDGVCNHVTTQGLCDSSSLVVHMHDPIMISIITFFA